MNFFERQDDARKKTKVLVFYFAAAVLLTVIAVNLAVFFAVGFGSHQEGFTLRGWLSGPYSWYVAIGTLVAIMLGSVFRTIALSGGGSAVAEMVGARLIDPSTADPDERRLVNVVEEMSIASGVPVPFVYVMDREDGINAFVAGFTPSESVMVVTRGALDTLDRDELQGVVGHEYSHILNGDMRINLRLIGILAGILAIGQIGYFMLRSLRYRSYSSRRSSKGSGGIILIGIALFVVGYVGLFFGRLIKAAISRQREYLADAASVQFTRNPSGIAGALLKIRDATYGSLLADRHAEEMSHMCFEKSVNVSFSQLMATHPPIEDRIRAIDPRVLHEGAAKKPEAGEAGSGPASAAAMGFASGAAGATAEAFGLSGSVGNPTPEHYDYAQELHSKIPVGLLDSLHNPRGATAAVYSLAISYNPEQAKEYLSLLQMREGGDVASLVMDFRRAMSGLGKGARLPLAELAVPALRKLPTEEKEKFFATLNELVELDKTVSLHEYSLVVLVRKYAYETARPDKVKYDSLTQVSGHAGLLISAMAYAGGDYEGGKDAMVGLGLEPSKMPVFSPNSVRGLDGALGELAMLPARLKRSVIDACVGCIQHDGRVTVSEAELLRAVSAALDCPMPPVLGL